LKVGFELYLDETPLSIEVAKEMARAYQVQVGGVCLGNRYGSLLERSGLPTRNLERYITEHWDDLDTSPGALRELEGRYGNPFATWFVYADKFIPSYDHERVLKLTVGHISFWEEYFDQERPDAFVGPWVQCLADLTRHAVALSRGVRSMGIAVTRMPVGRFCTVQNYEDRWDYVERHYRQLLDGELEPDDRALAEEFLTSFRESAMKPGYMRFAWPVPTMRQAFVKEFFVRLYNWYVKGWGRGNDYFTPNPWYSLIKYGTIMFKANLIRRLGMYSDLFEDPVEGEQFILFPLHYQPEASTLVLAPYFLDQVALIQNLAKSIPLSHKLYVKEHKSSLGRRGREYYRRIAALPNVRLLSPFANTRRLIQQADASVVITSTVGWEALLYERPTVVLGNTFYNSSGLTYRVTDVHQISTVLQTAIREHKPDRERLLKFIAALHKGSHEGEWGVPLINADLMQRDNIEKLARGIYLDIVNAGNA
jgi:hypothetical protein